MQIPRLRGERNGEPANRRRDDPDSAGPSSRVDRAALGGNRHPLGGLQPGGRPILTPCVRGCVATGANHVDCGFQPGGRPTITPCVSMGRDAQSSVCSGSSPRARSGATYRAETGPPRLEWIDCGAFDSVLCRPGRGSGKWNLLILPTLRRAPCSRGCVATRASGERQRTRKNNEGRLKKLLVIV